MIHKLSIGHKTKQVHRCSVCARKYRLLSYLHSESFGQDGAQTGRCFDWSDIQVCALVLRCFYFCSLSLISAVRQHRLPPHPYPPPSSPPHSFEAMANPYNQGRVCVPLCFCVCVSLRGGSTRGCRRHPQPPPSPSQSESPGWLTGCGECGSAACCHMRKSAYIQCLWT